MTIFRLWAAALSLSLLAACTGRPASTPDAAAETTQSAAVPLPEPDADGNIYTFRELDATGFKSMIGQPNTVLLDVRTREEIALGKIQGAVEMNVLDPNFREEAAKLDRSKTYLVYCASGGRSRSACNKMFDQGFRQLYNLDGGYKAYLRVNGGDDQEE